MYLAAGIRLHQHLPYKVFHRHYKQLGIVMGMMFHHIPLVHLEVRMCLEVGTHLHQFLLYIVAHREYT